jgi:serine/threonine protein kinase
MPLKPGDKIGPYEVVDFLGKGGMGEVYRAHDTNLSRDVGIKVHKTEPNSGLDRVQGHGFVEQVMEAICKPEGRPDSHVRPAGKKSVVPQDLENVLCVALLEP